jgi:hypothetical protein
LWIVNTEPARRRRWRAEAGLQVDRHQAGMPVVAVDHGRLPIRIEPFRELGRDPAEQREATVAVRMRQAVGTDVRIRTARVHRRVDQVDAGAVGERSLQQLRASGKANAGASGLASATPALMAGSPASAPARRSRALPGRTAMPAQTSARPPVLSSGKSSEQTCSTRIGGRSAFGLARPCAAVRASQAASISRVTSTTPLSVR